MKLMAYESSEVLGDFSVFDQGAGLFSFDKMLGFIEDLSSDQSPMLFPNNIDLTLSNGYSYPLSLQEIIPSPLPFMLNFSFVHPWTPNYSIESVKWTIDSDLGEFCEIHFGFDIANNAFTTFLSMKLFLEENNILQHKSSSETVKLTLKIGTISPDSQKKWKTKATVRLSLASSPPKQKRILFDQFHNLFYPTNGYLPRDSLSNYEVPFDWLGDHPFTNYHELFKKTRELGFYLEVFHFPIYCLDLSSFGILMILDPEDFFTDQEIKVIQQQVILSNLSLLIIADWSDDRLLQQNTLLDSSTNTSIVPLIGGSNLKSLNQLLSDFEIRFGQSSISGEMDLNKKKLGFQSGSFITQFPANGLLFTFPLYNETQLLTEASLVSNKITEQWPVIGLLQEPFALKSAGRVAVFGDSTCLDSAYSYSSCFQILEELLLFLEQNRLSLLENEFDMFQLPYAYLSSLEAASDLSKEKDIPEFSKHNNGEFTSKEVCPFPMSLDFDLSKLNKKEKEEFFLTTWESKKKGHKIRSYLLEYLLFFLVFGLVILGYLVRKMRTKKRRYQRLSQMPIIYV